MSLGFFKKSLTRIVEMLDVSVIKDTITNVGKPLGRAFGATAFISLFVSLLSLGWANSAVAEQVQKSAQKAKSSKTVANTG